MKKQRDKILPKHKSGTISHATINYNIQQSNYTLCTDYHNAHIQGQIIFLHQLENLSH
jgi:hypothetical protein